MDEVELLSFDNQNFSAENVLPRDGDASWSFNKWMLETALTVNKYYTPLLCLIGTLGNSLSVLVFCMDAKYRKQSASLYLSALAISDTGFLLSLLTLWLEQIIPDGGILTFSHYSCSLVMYLGQVTCFLSVYLTVAFSIERFIAVRCPFSRPRLCTRAKAKKCVAFLTTTALLIFSYAFIIAKVIRFPENPKKISSDVNVNENYAGNMSFSSTESGYLNISDSFNEPDTRKFVCTVPKAYFKISEIANYLDTIGTLIIPFFLITFFNIQIARSVRHIEGQRRGIVALASKVVSTSQKITAPLPLEVSMNGNYTSTSVGNKRNSINNVEKDKLTLKLESENEKASELSLNLDTNSQGTQVLPGSSSPPKSPNASPEVRVAKLLLLVSTTFLLLNLPSHVIRCAQFILTVLGSKTDKPLLRALQLWSHMLFNTSFAVNFLLYCLSGRNFRSSLNNLFRGMWGRRGRSRQHLYNHSNHHHHVPNQGKLSK